MNLFDAYMAAACVACALGASVAFVYARIAGAAAKRARASVALMGATVAGYRRMLIEEGVIPDDDEPTIDPTLCERCGSEFHATAEHGR